MAGRLTGVIILVGEEASKEQSAVAGATDDGQKICAFYAKEQRADGVCSFMDTHGFCNYVQPHRFMRFDKEGAREKEGAQIKKATGEGRIIYSGTGESTSSVSERSQRGEGREVEWRVRRKEMGDHGVGENAGRRT